VCAGSSRATYGAAFRFSSYVLLFVSNFPLTYIHTHTYLHTYIHTLCLTLYLPCYFSNTVAETFCETSLPSQPIPAEETAPESVTDQGCLHTYIHTYVLYIQYIQYIRTVHTNISTFKNLNRNFSIVYPHIHTGNHILYVIITYTHTYILTYIHTHQA